MNRRLIFALSVVSSLSLACGALGQDAGDQLHWWPSEDMQIRQNLKKRLNGKKDIEYQAVFDHEQSSKRRTQDVWLKIKGDYEQIPGEHLDRRTYPPLEPQKTQRKPSDPVPKVLALSDFVSEKLKQPAMMIERGDYDGAINSLNKYAAANPTEEAEAKYLNALSLQAIGSLDSAKELYEWLEKSATDDRLRTNAHFGLQAVLDKRKFIHPKQLRFPYRATSN